MMIGSKGKYVKKQGGRNWSKEEMVPGVWCCTSHVQKVYIVCIFEGGIVVMCGDGAGARGGGEVGTFFRMGLLFLRPFCDKFLLRK
jgi:hypothetical protein